MRRLLVLPLLLVLAAAGCDSAPDPTYPAYSFTLVGGGGAVAATGTLYTDGFITRGATVGGTYELDGDVAVSRTGRFEATCTGGPTTDDDRLTIELGAGPDAGLLLEGGCVDGVRGGVWSRYTVGGPDPQGTFDLLPVFVAL